ncbi:MAG: 50S ribosomal protein L18 [Candidatus Latescibacterota bacterium]
MKDKGTSRTAARARRRKHIRKKIAGSADRPRLCVYRGSKNIYAQLVDDVSGTCLLGVSSLSKEIREDAHTSKGKCELSRTVGKLLAACAREKQIEKVVFDRSGYLYHGRVKALAEGAREGGLQF